MERKCGICKRKLEVENVITFENFLRIVKVERVVMYGGFCSEECQEHFTDSFMPVCTEE